MRMRNQQPTTSLHCDFQHYHTLAVGRHSRGFETEPLALPNANVPE